MRWRRFVGLSVKEHRGACGIGSCRCGEGELQRGTRSDQEPTCRARGAGCHADCWGGAGYEAASPQRYVGSPPEAMMSSPYAKISPAVQGPSSINKVLIVHGKPPRKAAHAR